MMPLGTLQLLFVAWLGFALSSGVLASLLVPYALRATSHFAPAARHHCLLLLAVSPALLAFAAAASLLTPSVVALLIPVYDHCLVHPGHVHLCFVHGPMPSAGISFILLVAAGFFGRAAIASALELRQGSRLGAALLSRAERVPSLAASVLGTPLPLCVMVGVFSPRLLVSRGLIDSVTRAELAAIVEHERAHARRYDTLTRLAARAGSLLMLARPRGKLLDALELAAEQSCDEVAVGAIGDRLTMAEALLKVERLLQNPEASSALGASVAGGSIERRVASLLEAPRHTGAARLPVLALSAAIAVLFATMESLHHGAETLLGALIH